MLVELEQQVMEIYRLLDGEVAAFASKTNLYCPQGCGQCCNSTKVEATVLECIPLAFELFRTCQAELLLKRLERDSEEKQCILFRPDFSEKGEWGCTRYEHRALVCRLFGFAGNRDRSGNVVLAMCKVMKPGRESFENDPTDEDAPMPLFTDAGMRITSLHPSLGAERLPINQALMQALYKVGMYLDLAEPEAGKAVPESDPELPPDKPIYPAGPGRRRAA